MLIIRRNKSTGAVYYELEAKSAPKQLPVDPQPLPPVPRIAASGGSMKKWLRDNERLVDAFDGAVEDVLEDIVEEGSFAVTQRDMLRERLRRYLYAHSSSARDSHGGAQSAPSAPLHDDDATA